MRDGFHVDEYIADGGAVVGVRGREADGRQVEERATITIGADGRNSRLARFVSAQTYNGVPPILCYYFSYWQDVEAENFEMYVRGEQRRIIFSFRTEDDLFAVFVGLPADEFPQIRGDIEGTFMGVLDAIPGFGERVRAGRRADRFYGAADLPNFYRKPYGHGWALVGDAGLHKYPILGPRGNPDAFRDVEFLATRSPTALVAGPCWLPRGRVRASERGVGDRLCRETSRRRASRELSPQVLAITAAVRAQTGRCGAPGRLAMGMHRSGRVL